MFSQLQNADRGFTNDVLDDGSRETKTENNVSKATFQKKNEVETKDSTLIFCRLRTSYGIVFTTPYVNEVVFSQLQNLF
ncbi:hypothetical protein GOM46_00990 [Streptococcus infantis]|nr:hypothetical protein GOM46_00990 [Streptococcus infantis]